MKIATDGAKLLKRLADETDGNFLFEYSPESFTGTEIDYALDVCNAVLDVWQPRPDWKVIINLPVTVQLSMPHVYASQIEYMSKHMKYRENVVLSLIHIMTVDAVLLIQNLPCLQVLIVSRVLYLEMVNVQVTLTLSLLH